MDEWLKKYRDELPLWERILDRIPVIRRLRFIDRYYHDYKLKVKSFWQRRTKGFAHEECWNLAYSNATWILPRLKHFRDNLHSLPPNLEKGCEDIGHSVEPDLIDKQKPEERFSLTLDEWKSKLDEMIYAFEFVLTEDDIIHKCYPADYKWGWNSEPAEKEGYSKLIFHDDRKPDYTYYNECQKRHEEGLKLFALYYRHLWD